LHHFITDHTDQLDVLRPEIVLQVILQVHQSEIVVIVGKDTRTELYFLEKVNLQITGERIRRLDTLGECR
jgi:hypothetical protein